jgi:hypothetical protein
VTSRVGVPARRKSSLRPNFGLRELWEDHGLTENNQIDSGLLTTQDSSDVEMSFMPYLRTGALMSSG